MEQKFEKNIIERFGDFYSKLGRRFLFNLGCIVFFVLLELVLAGTGIGAFAAILWVYNLLSICEKEKTRYIKSVQITLPNGEKTCCALFEQSVYAYAPMILAFFSIGFYIPYKKQYILVRNMEELALVRRLFINEELHIITDASLYCWNKEAQKLWFEYAERITLPFEPKTFPKRTATNSVLERLLKV